MTRRTRPGLVFVADSAHKTFDPRIVMLGAGNFDYTEVVSGLKEGERVAMLARWRSRRSASSRTIACARAWASPG